MIVKLYVPGTVGVPESVPSEPSKSPSGRTLVVLLNVYGPVPPLAVMIWVYSAFAVASESVVGESEIVGGGLMIRL
jgi:hypothetical protein